MAYTDETKVKELFRQLRVNASGTVITDASITNFIDEADALINAKLSPYFVVPVTGVESLKLVGTVSKWLVGHEIKTVLESVDQKSDKVQEVQTNLRKKAMEMLDQMLPMFNDEADIWEDPLIPLTDAVRKEFAPKTAAVFRTQRTGKVPQSNPTIRKNEANW